MSLTCRDGIKAEDGFDKCCFPRTVWADQANHVVLLMAYLIMVSPLR